MKQIVILLPVLFAILTSCQTAQYHEPVDMTQKEIAGLQSRIIDRNGSPISLGAGKVQKCQSEEEESNNQCSWYICKRDTSQETGYACKVYISKAYNVDEYRTTMVRYDDSVVKKQVEDVIAESNKGKKTILANFCKNDHVVCYMNGKMFPDDKPISEKSYSKTVYSNSYLLKDKIPKKIDITVYQSK